MQHTSTCPNCGLALTHGAVCARCELSLALQSPSGHALFGSGDAALESRRFGEYELLGELGHGGMGVVYRARQTKLNRMVALKLLLLGQFSSEDAVKRFQREAQAAAALRHPNIVAIYDVGQIDGQHYFTMECVEGRSLASLLRDGPLPPRLAAAQVQALARAMSAAHQAGIIHRDLKPSNILIDPFEQPRITDFGLAKRLDGSGDITLTGHVLGSPNYLSPELAAGRESEAGPACDIFSLGAILYECLTGRPPFLAPTLQETLLRIRDTEPVGPRLLNPRLPRDLETICLKSLEKEPSRRYQTAQELADELGRYLNGAPIHARPLTRSERAWRWCHRRPALAAAYGLGLMLILVLALGGPTAAYHINRERRRAEAAASARRAQLYAAEVNLANEALRDANLTSARQLLARHQPRPGDTNDLRGFEWRYLQGQCRSQELLTLQRFDRSITSVRFTHDGGRLAVRDVNGNAWLLDATTGTKLAAFPAAETYRTHKHASERRGLALSRNSATLAVATGKDVALWDVGSGRHQADLRGHSNLISYLEFSPDGRTLASGSHDRTIRLWDLHRGSSEAVAQLNADWGVFTLAFSADGTLLAASGAGSDVKLWDLATIDSPRELPPLKGHITAIYGLAFSPTDRLLASAGAEIILSQLGPQGKVSSEKRLVRGRGGLGVIDVMTFTPDGQTLISAGTDRNITLWDVSEQRDPRLLMGHEGEILSLAGSPDGALLATASYDGSVKLWDIARSRPREPLMTHSNFVMAVAFSPDARLLASVAYTSPTIKLWDVPSQRLVRQRDAVPGGVQHGLGFSPDGRVLAAHGADYFRLLQIPSLLEITNLPGAEAKFSADGKELLYKRDGSIRRRHLRTNLEQVLPTGWERISTFAVSPDARALAAAGGEDYMQVRLWRANALDQPIELGRHFERVNDLAFSPDGRWLASASWDGTSRIWNLDAFSEPPAILAAHKGSVWTVAWSPDGRTLATGGDDYTIKLWSFASRQEAATLRGHGHLVSALTFSPDGNTLASCGGDGTVRLWRAPRLEPIALQNPGTEEHR